MSWRRRKPDRVSSVPVRERDGLYLRTLQNGEVYDLYRHGVHVAYLRLKFGRFTVEVPDVGGKFEYVVTFEDRNMSHFADDTERFYYLADGVRSVIFDADCIPFVRDLDLTYGY